MNVAEAKIFEDFKEKLYDKVEANDVMPHLVAYRVITFADMEKIKSDPDVFCRMLKLLDACEKKLVRLTDFIKALEKANYIAIVNQMNEALHVAQEMLKQNTEAISCDSKIPQVDKPMPLAARRKLNINRCIGKDPDGSDSLLLKMDDLEGADGTELYHGKTKVVSCSYEGNGKNLNKALAIINNNMSFCIQAAHLCVTHSSMQNEEQQFLQTKSIIFFHLYIKCNMSPESGRDLSRMVVSLFHSFTRLERFHLHGYGPSVGGIGEVYHHLPTTVYSIGFHDLSLPGSDISTISDAVSQCTGITHVVVSPSNRTIETMSDLLQALATCSNVTWLMLDKLNLTPDNEVKFLEGIKHWAYLEHLGLDSGMLHEAGQQKLHLLIQTLHSLKEVYLWGSISLPDRDSLKKICRDRNVTLM